MAPWELAYSIALRTFLELPLPEMPITKSPGSSIIAELLRERAAANHYQMKLLRGLASAQLAMRGDKQRRILDWKKIANVEED